MNNELQELRNTNTEKIMKLIDDKINLRLALECLKDEYVQYVIVMNMTIMKNVLIVMLKEY